MEKSGLDPKNEPGPMQPVKIKLEDQLGHRSWAVFHIQVETLKVTRRAQSHVSIHFSGARRRRE